MAIYPDWKSYPPRDAASYKGNDLDPDADGKIDHADLENVLDSQHHAAGIGTSGEYIIVAIFSAAVNAGQTTTSTAYTMVDYIWYLMDFDILPSYATGIYGRIIWRMKNDTSGETTYIQAYDNGTAWGEISVTGTSSTNADSGWIDLTGRTGLQYSHQRVKVTGGTGTYYQGAILFAVKMS